MSSQSNPTSYEEEEEIDSWTPERHDQTITLEAHRRGVARAQAHDREMNLAHHRGQTQEVQGGRTAARQQGLTDSSRGGAVLYLVLCPLLPPLFA